MDSLECKIKKRIKRFGVFRFDEYMNMCLLDWEQGYYRNKKVVGVDGDFVTSCEISQLFGELIAIWIILLKKKQNIENFNIVELGGGSGVLANDIISVLLANNIDNFSYKIIDVSESLRVKQKKLLEEFCHKISIEWHSSLESFEEKHRENNNVVDIFLGNEFFDCLAVRQLVKTNRGWSELFVSLDESENLCYKLIASQELELIIPVEIRNSAEGTIYEFSSGLPTIVSFIAERIRQSKGYGLFFDYGYKKSSYSSTIQSVYNHKVNDPLQNCGKADLTSHVDFKRLAELFRVSSCFPSNVITQKCFLEKMGIVQRIEWMIASHDEATNSPQDTENFKDELILEYQRLCDIQEMGALFKAICISSDEQDLMIFDEIDPLVAEADKNKYGLNLLKENL